MVFLKKFYAEGFKSFARPLTLNFNSTMIGVIGPNGSGKSNIVDGLRWAMGEQSNKTLRGKEKTNMIFVGSNDMKEADYALVELTFDNSNHVLHSDLDEVRISRKLIRKTGETIYSLNDQPCLLKDINNIFIDSGLGKGSLGIITQGSVNWFAEAKAEERRQMFESAAGIGKYIKQKEETLRNLEKATDNLSRLDQFERTLKREINELSKQVEKAKLYNEKLEKLKKYEISVSVQDYLTWVDELNELTSKVESAKQNLIDYKNEVKSSKELKDTCQSKYYEVDTKIKTLTTTKDELFEKINKLTYKKTRYISSLESQLSQGTIEERKQSYLSLISIEENTSNSLKKQIENYENILNDCESCKKLVSEKLASLKQEFTDASNDFQSKQRKYNELKAKFENNTSTDRGIRALLNARERFPGIINTIGNLIKVSERYEMAIQTSLGKSVSNLVVETDKVSIDALKFLKDNRLGRATFLPLNTIKPKDVRQDTLTIMSNLPGYIGIANELIKYEEKYQNAILNLLGNVIIADDIEHANYISKMINAIYKIITLDGDVIFASGAISGGQKLDTPASIFNLEEKMNLAKEEYDRANERFLNVRVEYEKLEIENRDLEVKSRNNSVSLLTSKEQLSSSMNKISMYKDELNNLDNLSSDTNKSEVVIQDFENELNELISIQNKTMSELKELDEIKQSTHDQLSKYSSIYDEFQNKLNTLINQNTSNEIKLNNTKNHISNVEERLLNAYGITIQNAIEEYNQPLDITLNEARLIINSLGAEIKELGNINFAALETLNAREEELANMEQEHKTAKQNVEDLIKLVNTLDSQAKSDFVGVIKRVNEIIPNVFKSLFGGGSCEIKLSDPSNVLESGIDVIVQLPGKKVSNLVLLSGGEKTLIALAVLFSLLKSSKFPLVLLDEAEAALDQANVSTFAKLIKEFSDSCQFIVITHRTGTMKMCDVLYGAMMRVKGVTDIVKTSFEQINTKKSGLENNG